VNRWPWMAECPRSPKTLSSHELAYLQDGEKGPVATLPTKALCNLPPLRTIRSLLCEKLPLGLLIFQDEFFRVDLHAAMKHQQRMKNA